MSAGRFPLVATVTTLAERTAEAMVAPTLRKPEVWFIAPRMGVDPPA
jgi:hypothetical protein